MEKKSFRDRIKSMPVKNRILAVIIVLMIVAIPVSAVAYQLNHKKTSKAISKNSKSSSSKNANGAVNNSKGGDQAGKDTPGEPRAVQTRLDRFNKEMLAKRIEQAQKSKRITDAQAKLLNKKLAEIEKFVKANKSKSSQEQAKASIDKRNELKQWAQKNDIPARYIAGWL